MSLYPHPSRGHVVQMRWQSSLDIPPQDGLPLELICPYAIAPSTKVDNLAAWVSVQSLDVSHCRGMQAEGIHAIATLTQLTALNLNTIGLIFEYQKGLNEFPTAHFPGILGLLSCLTGATLYFRLALT